MSSPVERVLERIRVWPASLRFQDVGVPGRFAVRAEIAGVDPVRDIRISATDRWLRVEVTRIGAPRGQVRSEFHYGRFGTTVDLPRGVEAWTLAARYHRGVLTIVGPSAEEAPESPLGDLVPIGRLTAPTVLDGRLGQQRRWGQ